MPVYYLQVGLNPEGGEEHNEQGGLLQWVADIFGVSEQTVPWIMAGAGVLFLILLLRR